MTKGEETKYKYDGVGNLISLTDRNDNTTKYEYDALNRQFKTIDGENGVSTTVYDGLVGNVPRLSMQRVTKLFIPTIPGIG